VTSLRRKVAEFFRVAEISGVTWAASKALDQIGVPAPGMWPERNSDIAVVQAQLLSLFRAWGMSEEHASITAQHVLYADVHGIDSHGCGMLWEYHQGLSAGRLNMAPAIEIVREATTTALIDGGGGLGHVPADIAMRLAILKCRSAGVSVVTVRNSGHFGAAGAYAAMASREGLIGLVTTNNRIPSVVPTFGKNAMLGTNPIAFSAPAGANQAFLLDMATSTAPVGKLTTAWRKGRDIPDGWALDEEGRSVTDARRASELRRLTPLGSTRHMGSHKGYGLAAMVEILCSVLPGLRRNAEGALIAEPRVGHCFLVLDPQQFREAGAFEQDMDGMMDALRNTASISPEEPVLVAGDPEYTAKAKAEREGVALSRAILEDMRLICTTSNVPFLLDRQSK
jgi:LDH2 family malate/lactate/ureidoglycolate dehydrogenase